MERVLLQKHLIGDFGVHQWSTVKKLLDQGYIAEEGGDLVVTKKGVDYCDKFHREIKLSEKKKVKEEDLPKHSKLPGDNFSQESPYSSCRDYEPKPFLYAKLASRLRYVASTLHNECEKAHGFSRGMNLVSKLKSIAKDIGNHGVTVSRKSLR
jgi:hypothetical protein